MDNPRVKRTSDDSANPTTGSARILPWERRSPYAVRDARGEVIRRFAVHSDAVRYLDAARRASAVEASSDTADASSWDWRVEATAESA